MPKIISLTSLGDTLYVLYDSGFIFASSGEKSWYRVTLPRPYQIEEAITLTNATPSLPLSEKLAPEEPASQPLPTTVFPRPIRPSWPIWLSHIRRKTDWFVMCPVCRENIQSTDTAMLRHHWDAGHFDCKPEAPEGYEGLTGK